MLKRARFDIEKSDHPEGNRWHVIDRQTGMPALVNDVPQIHLPFDDADDLADLLSGLDVERVGAVVQ